MSSVLSFLSYFWCKLLDAIVKIKVSAYQCRPAFGVISCEEKQYKNFLPSLHFYEMFLMSKRKDIKIRHRRNGDSSLFNSSYQYEIQMLSAVAEECKSVDAGVWMLMCLSPARFSLICTPHCFSLITFRLFRPFTISTRRSTRSVSRVLAVF
jgi:hypothetical protein